MGFFHKENVFLYGLIYCLVSTGVLIALVLLVSFLGTNIGIQCRDFTCNRSSQGVECKLIRHTKWLKPTEIAIHNPVAVDLDECDIKDIFGNDSHEEGYSGTEAEIRSKGVSYKITIFYSSSDRQAVRAVAKEINDFLLSSNAPSFHTRF